MNKKIEELLARKNILVKEIEDKIEDYDVESDDADTVEQEIDEKTEEVKSIESKIEKIKKLEDIKRFNKELKAKEAVEADDEESDSKEKDEDEILEEKTKYMNSFNINKGISSLNLPKGSQGITKEIIKTLANNYSADAASNMIRNEAGSKSAADMIVKNALTTSQPTVAPDVRNETVALLTADCVVRQHARTVSMPMNNLTYPRLRLGASASWVGEGSNYVPSAQDFDTINFVGKKLTGFTYTTLEFNNFSLSDAVAHVVSDLQNQVALAEDRTFIMGSTAGSLAPSYSLVGNAGTTLTSTGADSVSVAADLANIKSALQTKFVNISRGVVFGSPAIFNALENLQTSFGVYPFREEIRMGKLNGFTIAATAQIPTDVDTSAAKDGSAKNGSPLIFVAPQHLIIADAMRYDVRSTDVGSWTDGSTQMNAFAEDLIAYKLANWVDFGVEHDAAVAVLNTVGWTNFNVDGAWQYVAPAQTGGNSASASKGKGA